MAEARGQTARYLKVFGEYQKAPDVTRERLYLETMERVLGAGDKIILDRNSPAHAAPAAGALRHGEQSRAGRQSMNAPRLIAILAGAVLLLLLALSSTFEVNQIEQALLLRFGAPAPGRGLITDPGLHFKWPLIESVVYIDKRILDLESPKQEILASDNQRLEVDAFVRYRIADALKFYQTVGSVARRQPARLGAEFRLAPRARRRHPDPDRARRRAMRSPRKSATRSTPKPSVSESRSSTRASAASICRCRFPRRCSTA